MPHIDFEQKLKPDIEYTVALIKQLHAGQTDQTGKPYANHPQRVVQNVRRLFPDCSDDVVMAALLHDVIEDCGVSEADLRQKNYSPACIEIVSLVTKNPEDKRNYDEVIDNLVASGNREAMMVKIADNMDNLHPRRVHELNQIDPEKAKRLGERYRRSIEKLADALKIKKDRVFGLIESIPSSNPKIQEVKL
jgi:(p)ppGpp synthase/HD superfamily hydrolase